MKKITSVGLYMTLLTFLCIEPCNGQGTAKKHTYACVPVAASVALRYFNIHHKYQEIYSEMDVKEETGYASLGDLVKVCKKRDLYCQAYRGLNIKRIKEYLRCGSVIVVHVGEGNTQHAIPLFEINGRIAAYDVLRPLHHINMERFERFLSDKVLCVVVSNERISAPYSVSSKVLGMSLAVSTVIWIVFSLCQKMRKE